MSAATGPSIGATMRNRRLDTFSLVVIGAMLAVWSVHLWPQWLHNPDLSHGLFTPVIFVLLVVEARTRGTPRFLPGKPAVTIVMAAALLAGLILLAIGGLYAAALGWSHSLVDFVLAAALTALLGAAWLHFSQRSCEAVPFNWPAMVAILVWFMSAPIPPGTYSTMTRELQAGVTTAVLAVLHILGVAAVKNGNIIELANVSVGVEEACSGVRSLISCVFAGFFFSACLVRRPWARVVIVALAAPLALFMNVLRSLTLTLLANSGVEIRGAWHDITGFAILGVTAAALAGLAVVLEKSGRVIHETDTHRNDGKSSSVSDRAVPHRVSRTILPGGLGLAASLVVVFVVNTRSNARLATNPPDLAAILPETFEGWQVVTSPDLYRFSAQLQTESLVQRTYARETPAGVLQMTVYLAYWPPGQAPVSLVAAHTPDACWPGSGWVAKPLPDPRARVVIEGRALSEAEHRLFTQEGYPQNVWYWHIFGGQPIYHEGVGSPRQLLWLALHYGFRSDGDQLFVRVSSNQPWENIAAEPLLREVFSRLKPLGL